MLFNSFEFALFFAAFLSVFFSAPDRWKGIILLLSSYIFYMAWRPSYVLLLILTTVVDYSTARVIDGSARQELRRAAMIAALTVNVGILATLKYLDFFLSNVMAVAGFAGFHLDLPKFDFLLPVGISFYTFQSIGYTLDVYNRRVRAERSFLVYAEYVAFFPQLVAGPIERAGHLLSQMRNTHRLRAANVAEGSWLIGFGLFKKMCVADLVSGYVQNIFSQPTVHAGPQIALAVVLFALQIYCDFSGYSTIARGVAKIMDFDLMINFRQPYFATSLTDFWRGWHISLSTWFRDYVYLPLGGNRVSEGRAALNVMTVFVLSGIWHGAAWTFFLWGALHGAGLVVERAAKRFGVAAAMNRLLGPLTKPVGWLWTMTVVLAGWVFFRAQSFQNAVDVFRGIAAGGPVSYPAIRDAGLSGSQMPQLVFALLLMFGAEWLVCKHPQQLARLRANPYIALPAGVGLLYTIIFFGVFGHSDFIYFQF